MKPWLTDRPDLERRDRIRDLRRRLASILGVPLWRVDEMLQAVVAPPPTKQQLTAALLDPANRETLRAAVYDLIQDDVIETVKAFMPKGRKA